MIKVDENKIYMTFGEGCYALAVDGGRLKSVCFGARVEPEDDMTALGFALSDEGDRVSGGELCDNGFESVFAEAETLQKPTCAMPTLGGENTLKLTLVCDEKNIEQALYYTTYSRGAIARRVEIKNNGIKSLTVKNFGLRFTLPAGFEKLTECGCGAVLGAADGRAAYGFVAMFGGDCVYNVVNAAGDTCVEVNFGTVKVKAGETVSTPEVIAAYSDIGVDGVSRVFHDIIRERAIGDKRRRLVVECDGAGTKKQLENRITAAAAIGADTLLTALDGSDGIKVSAELCAASGIGLGLRLDALEFGGMRGFDAEFVKTDDGGKPYFDFSDSDCAEFFKTALVGLVTETAASFLAMPHELPRLAPDKLYAYLVGQYAFLRELNAALPELVIEGSCGDMGALCYAATVYCEMSDALKRSVYFPPCALAVRVSDTSELKRAFDCASLYCLGYALDPAALSESLRRAIRAQVFSYQDEARLIVNGDFYRGVDFVMCVSKEKSRAYAVYFKGKASGTIKFIGLDAHNLYHVRELDKTFSGAALISYGIPACSVPEGETVAFRLRQVADYE